MVSIIIPFYNAETSLEKTLASVEAQTFNNWGVIFIDDGSTDSSPLIAQKFLLRNPGKGKIIQSSKAKSGPAVCRNQALQEVAGSYVICLDSDDLLAPFCLKERMSVMHKNPDLGWAVFNQYQCRPGENEPYQLFNRPAKTRSEAIAFFLKMDPAWQTMAPIWKTDALRNLGGFDESLYIMEDPDLHLRALLEPGLPMKIMFDLPADCYYFVNEKSDDKISAFWHDSIDGRFRFIKKTIKYLPGKVPPKTLKVYKSFIHRGFILFFNTFLLSRLKNYKKEVQETISLLRKEQILSIFDIIIIKAIMVVFTSSSPFFLKIKLKGIVHKLFLQKGTISFRQ